MESLVDEITGIGTKTKSELLRFSTESITNFYSDVTLWKFKIDS